MKEWVIVIRGIEADEHEVRKLRKGLERCLPPGAKTVTVERWLFERQTGRAPKMSAPTTPTLGQHARVPRRWGDSTRRLQ